MRFGNDKFQLFGIKANQHQRHPSRMGSIWILPPTLFVFLFSSLVLRPSSSQIQVYNSRIFVSKANESEIRSYRHRVPRECQNSFETIQCFEKCKDHENISILLSKVILEQEKENGYHAVSQIALRLNKKEAERVTRANSLDFRPGLGTPCDNKCQTDPLYWSCVQDCDERDHTEFWLASCFTVQTQQSEDGNGNPTYPRKAVCDESDLRDTNCLKCLLFATEGKLNRSCEIAQLPDVTTAARTLCETMNTCNGTSSTTVGGVEGVLEECSYVASNVEMMRLCVNDKIMFAQRECCYSEIIRNTTGCGSDMDKCDEFCMKILSPRLCREKCLKLRNVKFTNCIDLCDFVYSIDESSCDHCDNSTPIAQASQAYTDFHNDRTCVEKCDTFSMACIRACLPYGGGGSSQRIPRYLTENCYSLLYISNFTAYVMNNRKRHYWPMSISYSEVDYASWMTFLKLPFDCMNNICPPEPLTTENMKDVCQKNPFRKIDFLACAIVQTESRLNTLSNVLIFPELSRFLKCVDDPEYEVTQAILYKMIYEYERDKVCAQRYCSQPNRRTHDDDHPNAFRNIMCKIFWCQPTGGSEYCKPVVSDSVIDLEDYGVCRWKVDFSKWETPYKLWSTYFNELHPAEIKHKLEYPDATEILSGAMFGGKKAYYSFPYFIIVRSVCDDGYYSVENYKHVTTGSSPIIELQYKSPTNRHWPKNVFMGVFKTALINLQRFDDDDEDLVPENPKKRLIKLDDETAEEIGCPENICYPAFAAPLMFLSVPKFQVNVLDIGTGSFLSRTVYVSQFHSRVAAGRGEIYEPGERNLDLRIYHDTPKVPAHPGHLFPLERSTFAVDEELNYHQNCFANGLTDKQSKEYYNRKCPELEHVMDDFDNPYEANYFAPLDAEDIFRSQYTYGTSPTQAIAGFYDPKYIVIGDADMNQVEVADWSKLLTNLEANESFSSCYQGFKHRGHGKPMYSQLDRTDTTYPIKFFRQRYAPKPYYTSEKNIKAKKFADTAIFEAIGLEDRLLLITNKGLVSFYGHSNSTVYMDKAWEYRKSEVLNRCFKIVRILPAAQPNSDLIVGITFDYIVRDKLRSNDSSLEDEHRYKEIAQEVWVGNFVKAGEDIQWREIREKPKENVYLAEPVANLQKLQEGYETFKPDKDPGLPPSMREANPRSQIEAICYKAYRTKINKYNETKGMVRLVDEIGWCVAMDATPVQLRENAIQVLVRMRTYFNRDNTKIYFYLVATHLLSQFDTEVQWTIDTILPRYPCIDEHKEAVGHVTHFDERYFVPQYRGTETFHGCHTAHEDRLDFHIFLHGMTYPRALSNHLFLYGSRLLQSTNNGRNFMFLKGFPQKFQDFISFNVDIASSPSNPSGSSMTAGDVTKNRPLHRIVKMAFDDGGHYAFITNKLELWYGSTGSIRQIRLRPSPLQSMVQLSVSQVRNFHDGIPFTLDFDSNNRLYEMVAIVGERGHVTKIMKRFVYEWKLLRIQKVLDKFKETSDKMYQMRVNDQKLSDELQKPMNYDIAKWSTFCGYISPSLRQNFSKAHSRLQGTFFPHPEQHLTYGKAHLEPSLMAFQAITFSLVWESYFEPPIRFYAGKDRDPYISWVVNRKFAAFATMKTTLFSQEVPPEEHSILIQPLKYKRIVLTKIHSALLRNYFIDYNITAELKLEFSIRNEHEVYNTEFGEDQINSVELNVENSNGSIIQINTEKEVRADEAAVLFIVRMSVKRKTGISQTLPGERYIPVPVTYHLIGAFGNCIADETTGVIGDKIETIALVGCPPNRDFVFDWNATLNSIKLRADRIESNRGVLAHGIGGDCHDEEYVCIFARSPATLYFEIYDETKLRHVPYTGKYIMRLIGGGRTRDTIRLYSNEEIDAFNIVGVSDASLAWNEWDPILHQKVDRRSRTYYSTDGEEIIRKDNRESILTSGVSVVAWVCHTLSPCARVTPTTDFEVVFWFRILITNRDVDSDTLCLYEKEFDVMLYGFPPSPEFQLLATLGFCFLLLGILYLVFLCTRQEQKMLMSTKAAVKNWYFIIKDAIPKKLRFYELPLPEEAEKHEKPKKFRGFSSEEPGSREASFTSIEMGAGSAEDVSPRGVSSSSTLESGTSVADSSSILPTTKKLHTTTKQIVYDQILTRRLNSIVERNRQIRTNLIKKASIHKSQEEFEHESNFQKQFGRTVSQESVFTPPMPKDRKRGIDSFL